MGKLVDLTVIYPKVSNIQVTEEIVYGSDSLSEEKREQIEHEYYKLIEDDEIAEPGPRLVMRIVEAVDHRQPVALSTPVRPKFAQPARQSALVLPYHNALLLPLVS